MKLNKQSHERKVVGVEFCMTKSDLFGLNDEPKRRAVGQSLRTKLSVRSKGNPKSDGHWK